MMLTLILAQLVLPWPGLDSPLVQPPGMICLGACAGPVIYGPAEQRGRLVVACDMRSDTCSDGRRITTTRATPVPCETSPGVWETVGVDEGCYSVRGLESWAQNTSYLSWGAELDREPWGALRGGTIEALADGYRVTSAAGESLPSGRIQILSPEPEEGPVTLSCIVRTQQPIGRLTLEAGTGVTRHFAPFDTAGKWERVSVSGAIDAGAARWVGVGPRNTDLTPASVDVKACWLTKSDTPPCWGGEAPVTCGADRHTVSTEGWPTEAGEVEIVFNYGQVIGRPERLIDGRSIEDLQHFTLFISSLPGNPLTLSLDSTVIVQSSSLSWEAGKVYRVRLRRTLDGEIELFRDGVRVAAASGPPLSWSPRAVLGGRYDSINSQQLNGSISNLRIRSFE